MPSFKLCPICKNKKIDKRGLSCWECFMDTGRCAKNPNKNPTGAGGFREGQTPWNKGFQMCSPQWNGGETKNNQGRVMVVVGYRNNGLAIYKAKSRVVTEWVLGRPLKRKEIVHHVNGDLSDDKNCNLLICDHNYHMWLHKQLRRRYGKNWREKFK